MTAVVLRGGQEMSVSIPVVHWTPAAIWRHIASPGSVISLLGGGILAFVGFFTYSRRPDLPSARALLMLCAASAATVASGLLPDGPSVTFNLSAYILTSFFSYAIFGIVLAPSLLAFSLHFPRTKQVILRHRWLGYIPLAIGLIIAIAVYAGEDTAVVGWLGTMAMIVTSIASLVHAGFTQRDAVSRAQLRWAIGGFIVGLVLFLPVFPSAFGWISSDFWASLLGSGPSIGTTVIGVSLAIAVLRYRLFDIDVIIRRTLIYSVVTALLTLVFFGGVTLLQSLFSAMTAERSELAIVISTLTIAALFTPVRNRVQHTVDRVFYRRKYDAQRTLAQFGTAMQSEVEIEGVKAALLRAVDETLQPESIGFWVKKESA